MDNKIRDPYNAERNYKSWEIEKKLDGVNSINRKIILEFLDDMSIGHNVGVGTKKGARSYKRLNALRSRLKIISNNLQDRGINDIRKINSKQIFKLFDDMRKGVIKNRYGKTYMSTGDYVKDFKTFWHWYQLVERKKGIKIDDICIDLDRSSEKPKFVYFTEDDFGELVNKADYDLKIIMALAYDSGMRVTELINIKVSDFVNDFKEVIIRDETSKTFGRRIKLMMCSNQISNYVKKLNLKPNNFLSQLKAPAINKRLRKLGNEVLTPEQVKYKTLSLYDFRHSSACFWLPKYKSESALKYRFGWKRSDMIEYYTQYLGMSDTITQDDMYDDVTKTELERRVKELEKMAKLLLKNTPKEKLNVIKVKYK